MVKVSDYWKRRLDNLTIETDPEKVKQNMKFMAEHPEIVKEWGKY